MNQISTKHPGRPPGRSPRRLSGLIFGLVLATTFAHAAEPIWRTLPIPPPPPAPSESGTTAVNGARLHYALYGKGEPLILLHGGLGNGENWANQIPAFAARYRVLTIDSRGHGRSTRGTGSMSYRQMADDVVAVMDTLHIPKAAVVGWSDGGIIGLDMAIRYPARLTALVTYGTNYRTDGLRDDIVEMPTSKEWGELAKRESARISPAPAQYEAFAKELFAMYQREPNYTDEQVRSIRTPTLIAAGYHEEYYRIDHFVALARLIPGAELAILPGASHFGVWQVPQAFNRMALDFLTK